MTSKFSRRLLAALGVFTAMVLVVAGRNWARQTVQAAGETNELQQVLRDEAERARTLSADGAVVLARIRAKNAIARELIDGRTDLAGAAGAASASSMPRLRTIWNCSASPARA